MAPRGIGLLAFMCLAVIASCAGCAQLESGTPQKIDSAENQAAPVNTDGDHFRTLKIRGVMKDHEGKPLTGVVSVIFAIYDQQREGAPLWQEVQNVEADPRGRFTALLGATGSGGIPAYLFTTEKARWLGEQVMMPGELEYPRVRLSSAPEGLVAEGAMSVVIPRESSEQATQAGAQEVPGETAGSQQPSQQDQSEPDDKPQTARRRLRRRPTE